MASPLYAITHFDSSQSDSTPYGPPSDVFTVDLTKRPIVYSGPVNIMTLAPTNTNAVGMNTISMDSFLKNLFGENYPDRLWNGIYSLVDKDNVLYANSGNNLYAFALSDSNEPSKGITKRYALEDAVTAIQGNNHQANTTIAGLSMTYDGYIVITFNNGVAVIDRDLNASSASFCKFGDDESVTNSIAIDENNGIYVASNTIMHKLV